MAHKVGTSNDIDFLSIWKQEYAEDRIDHHELERRLDVWFHCMGNGINDQIPAPSEQELVEIDLERQRIKRERYEATTLGKYDKALQSMYCGPIVDQLNTSKVQ